MTHVAVVIVGFRNADEVRACIGLLAHSSHVDFSVHVCENGGSAAYAALVVEVAEIASGLVATQPGGRILERCDGRLPGGRPVHLYDVGENLGYAGGINVCLSAIAAHGTYDAVWILNPDTEPATEAMAALIERQQAGGYGIVGSRLVLKDSGTIQLYGGRMRKWMARGLNIGLHAPADATPDSTAIEREMDYVAGASMYACRAYVEQVGQFDERYFLYYEETDWCFRRGAWRLGYAHESVVVHAHGTTIGSSVSRATRSPLSVYLDERNKLLFTRRFYRRSFPVVALITLALTAQYAKARAWQNFGIALAGWWAGIRDERGFPHRFG
jgi:N-acetylglucosaminyl-diphospho-decaprenol L-rhamnosyltransferase